MIVFLRVFLLLGLSALLFNGCAGNKPSTSPEGDTASTASSSASPDIRVCLTDDGAAAALSFNGNYRVEMEEANYRFDASIGEMNIMVQGGSLILKNQKRFFELSPPQSLHFRPENADNKFTWNKVDYYGALTLHYQDDGYFVVNTLPLELYLQGVVANEIPTNQSEYREAVVAQAIASRSYALHRIDNPVSEIFDLHADKPDQVYRGREKASSLSDRAVTSTQGVVLTQLNQPAAVQFHSTSGGVLESRANGDAALAGGANTYSPDSVDGEDNDKVSPFYRWVENPGVETILRNLKRIFELDNAMVQRWYDNGFHFDVVISDRKPSGRVNEVVIKVNDRSFVLDRDDKIQQAFADESGKPLPSTLFFLKQPGENTETVYILGAGAGHGKGMSQWGAVGLALKGYDHRYILAFYYPDYTISQYY